MALSLLNVLRSNGIACKHVEAEDMELEDDSIEISWSKLYIQIALYHNGKPYILNKNCLDEEGCIEQLGEYEATPVGVKSLVNKILTLI